MNSKKLIYLVIFTFFLFGCELKMAPSPLLNKILRTQTDSNYYKGKTEDLVDTLTADVEEYEINKVTVLDLVDEANRPPILGEYLSSRVVEAFTKKNYFQDRTIRVAQKGEVQAVLDTLKLKNSYMYNREEIRKMGKALNSQAIITGRLTDLGTNIDVHLTLTDVVSGEVIASATEHLTRTKFAVEMLRQY